MSTALASVACLGTLVLASNAAACRTEKIIVRIPGVPHVLIAEHGPPPESLPSTAHTEELAEAPKVTLLRGNTPNPFNPATTIFFDLAEKARVELRIYDVRGRLVRQLLRAEREPGSHAVVWDGKTAAGRPVASSIYFLHMQAGSVSMSRRLIVVR